MTQNHHIETSAPTGSVDDTGLAARGNGKLLAYCARFGLKTVHWAMAIDPAIAVPISTAAPLLLVDAWNDILNAMGVK